MKKTFKAWVSGSEVCKACNGYDPYQYQHSCEAKKGLYVLPMTENVKQVLCDHEKDALGMCKYCRKQLVNPEED